MRRVVITGMGIVSSLGSDVNAVADSLKAGKSGIGFVETYKEKGFRSHVAGVPEINLDELIDRKTRRFMGDAAAYAYVSMQQAIDDAGLTEEQVSNPKTGLIMGSGGASTKNVDEAINLLNNGAMKVGKIQEINKPKPSNTAQT